MSAPGAAAGRAQLAWSALATGLMAATPPALLVVLASWLTPVDVGLAGVASLCVALALCLQSAGPALALVRVEADEARALAPAVLAAHLVVGLGLYAAIWLGAPLAAHAFGAGEVVDVLRLAGLRVPLGLAGAVPAAFAQRDRRFRLLATTQAWATAVAFAVALPMAVQGRGVWALIVGALVGDVARVAALFAGLGAQRPRLDWPRLRPHVRSGLLQWVHAVQAWSLNYGDNVIVGGLLGVQALGFYSLGFNMAFAPLGLVGEAISRVAYPAFAGVAADREALRGRYLAALRLTAAGAIGGGALVSALAAPLVALLFGPRWGELVAVVAWFGWFAGCWTPLRVNVELLRALDRPGAFTRAFGVLLALGLPAWALTVPHGLAYAVPARTGFLLLAVPLLSLPVLRALDLPALALVAAVRGPVLAAAATWGGVSALRVAAGFPSPAWELAAGVPAGVILYGLTLAALDPGLARELWAGLGAAPRAATPGIK